MPRLGFDPDRTLVATSGFQGLAAGETFDWRARGMHVIDVLPLYQAGLIDHPTPSRAAPATPRVEAPPPATVQSPEASVSAGGSFVAESSGPDTMPIGDRKPGERVTFDPPPPDSKPGAPKHGRRSR